MSKVIFVKCSNKKCKYGRSYPVDVKMVEMLKKCPQCDPKAHRAVKNAKQQAKMISNKPKRQSFDAGRVQSLDAGAKALKELGVDLTDGADGLGTEVDYVPTASEAAAKAKGGHQIPIISAADAKASAKK